MSEQTVVATRTAAPSASEDGLRMRADVGRYTIAKTFVLDARAITAFAGGVGDYNPVYFADDRDGGLVAHPGMVFSWQWNARFTPDVEYDLALVRRNVHAWVDVRFDRAAREGDAITCQGRSIGVRQTRAGVLTTQRYWMRDSSGDLVATMDTGGMARGARLEGGDAELAPSPPLPRRSEPESEGEAVWSVELPIASEAPHVYTECADIWNPIHTERRVALAAGLPDIILHGSANIAIALREVINRSFDGDPTRLRRFAGQFRGMVIPGRSVTVRSLEERREEDGSTTVFFEMLNHDGEPAIANGVAVG